MQHFGYVVCFFWKSRCNEPPLREIRDSMGAIRSFWTIFRLDQNRGHCKLTLYIFFIYGMNKLTEYWTWERCKIVGKISLFRFRPYKVPSYRQPFSGIMQS